MSARRLDYLRAMGIDVWVRRDNSPADTGVAVETARSPIMTDTPRVEVRDSIRAMRESLRDTPTSNANVQLPTTTSIAANLEPAQSSVQTFDWPALEIAVKACSKCDLHKTRTQTVFGVGNRQAEWMVIGEAPGADEDAQGEPFVGRAGQLLNSMLKAVGLKREQVFIANILKCRPPQNRDPQPNEALCCTPFLHRQIELVNPKLLLCVGRISAQNLLQTDTPIGKLRGQVHRFGPQQRPVVVTYHPAYLLRSPGEKRRAWEDLVLALKTAPLS